MIEMPDQVSISRSQWIRAVLVLAGNFVFFSLLLAVIGLFFMKYLAVSGTPHPETFRYHATVFAPYFVATTVIVILWRIFQDKSGQSEIFSQFETRHVENEGGGE